MHRAIRFRGIEPWLAAKGAKPSEVARRYGAEGYGPSLYFSDPEGNLVELKGPADSPRLTATCEPGQFEHPYGTLSYTEIEVIRQPVRAAAPSLGFNR